MIVPEPRWDRVVCDLEGTVFLLGASDCGKTTLARWISTQIEGLAYIDGDPGQSVLGPPGTLGLALPDGSIRLRFAGAFSPSHALLATLAGLRRLLDAAAAEGQEVVLVDSCGYIWGDGGVEFQRRSIEVLRPDRIVAIGRQPEIGRILAPFPAIPVHRIPPAPAVRRRSQGERRRYRAGRFARYLEEAEEIVVGSGVRRIGHATTAGHFAALLDADGWVLTAGIVGAAGPEGVTLTAPPPTPGTPAYLEVADFRPDLPPRYLQEE